jgi:hypothetical protein
MVRLSVPDLRGAQREIVASGRGGGGAFAFTSWHFASFLRHFRFSKRWNWLDVGRQQAAQKRAAQVAAGREAEEEEAAVCLPVNTWAWACC